MFAKSHDCLLVLTLVIICPQVINLTIMHLHWNHRLGFFLIGLAAIVEILRREMSEIDTIQQVFEAKKVDVDGKFPRLVRGEKVGEENI